MGAGKDDFRMVVDVPDGDPPTRHLEYHRCTTYSASPAIPPGNWADLCDYADADDFDGFDDLLTTLIPDWWGQWGESAKHQYLDAVAARNG